MKKIAILGSGYVGKAAASFWKYNGQWVSVSTRKPERIPELMETANAVFILTEDRLKSLKSLLNGQDVLLICVAPDPTDSYRDTYLHTALQVTEVLRDNPEVKQIIYVSSTSVYGNHNGSWVDEETPPLPENPSTQILAETETVLLSLESPSRAVCILRVGEIIGPGRDLVERLRKNCSRPFPGNGENWTNLIHLNDLVQGIDFAQKNNLRGVYNLCSDLHVRRKELYAALCKEHNLPEITWNPEQKSLHAGNKRVSNRKIKEAGFFPTAVIKTK